MGFFQEAANAGQWRLTGNDFKATTSPLGIKALPIQPTSTAFLERPAGIKGIVIASDGRRILIKCEHVPVCFIQVLPGKKRGRFSIQNRSVKIKNQCSKHCPEKV